MGSNSFMAIRAAIRHLEGLSIQTNAILEALSPPAFKASQKVRQNLMDTYAWAEDLLRSDPLLAQGRSINYNRMTTSHTDRLGPDGEWTPMIALGFSSGAKVRLAGIQEILLFDPGTILFIRGGEIPHAVEAWSGGQRISIAIFTHDVIWREFGIRYPWSYPRKNLPCLVAPRNFTNMQGGN